MVSGLVPARGAPAISRSDRGPPAGVAPTSLNTAELVRAAASRAPQARAVITPGPREAGGRRTHHSWSFAELEVAIDRQARGLRALGVEPGARCLMMVKPSFEFFTLTFALFRMGAIPVMIDPGMGKESVLGAIREVEPEVMLAIPKGHVARLLFPRAFRSVRRFVTVGRRWLWGGSTLSEVERLGQSAPAADHPTKAEDTAAILFTSGSTGAPKGVLYTHAIFCEQVRIFREELGIEPGEVDLSAFPLFSLFSVALGATCVIPDMDASRPAQVDPRLIVESISDLGVTYSFGSPAFWRRIAAYCSDRDPRLGSLRRVLMAGAPAPVALLERLDRVVPERASVFTPYGATECLPITMPSAKVLLAGPLEETKAGRGTCVGGALGRTEVRVIRITDEPIPELEDAEQLPPGEIGELIVSGPVTTRSYFRRPVDDERSKIRDGARVWHRMGDVGWIGEQGDVWFCGRKSHRVETTAGPMYTECVEAIFNQHPGVRRSALVGLGARPSQRPVIIVELEEGARRTDRASLARELLARGRRSPLTSSIDRVLFHDGFPVDPRHNAKIIREQLAVWAEEQPA